ncbi:MAG: DEAD/DEAH box helicase, partial [Fibrobacteres bacterium]|nr:DEAD/DEAH box helicase [Fibrobacterota bacterium]
EILFPVIGLANLNKVQLQYPILGENGVLYHSDFMISIGGSQFAIEIESAIHREKSVHIKDTERQNALIATGFTVLRYVTSEFQQNTQKVQDQLKIDLRLNQKSDSDTILNAEELFLLFFEREFGNACGRFTEFLLELYIHNDLENTKIHILDYSLSYCLLTMIEHDIRTVIEHAMKIWNVNLFIPELIIDTIAMTSDRALFESCWKEYTEIIWHHQNSLYACADIITKPTIINSDKPQDPIKSMFSVNYDVILLDQPLESFTNGVEFYQFIYKLFKITATDGRLEVLQSREEGRNIDVTNPQWHRLSNLERPSYISESIALFYLFRWFSHQAFRDGQYAIIEKALLKGSVLGVLPTGAGKSVCFQIPALLIPGISLVVSPLKSLMLDQHRILKERHKLLCVSRIASDVTPSEQKRTIEKVLDGEIKLLYVAPERLQMVEFKKNLESIMSRISLLILDEVHCLSEWGHDFRPSYLSVRDLIESNTRSFGLIALTATAPKLTREDICTQLNLDIETDTVNASTLDRVNLSFEVRKFNNQEEKIGWATVFLDKNGNNVFLKTHPNIRLKDASGIFFSLYGTASGKKTSQLNVKNIKKKMEGKNYTIDYYCGEDKGEQVCPYCKHNEVIYHAGHNGAYNEYKCHVCQKLYSSDKSKLDCLPVSAMESNGKWMCVDCKTQFKSENYKKGIKNHYTCSNCNKNWTDSPGYKNKSWDIEKGRIQKEFTEGKIHRIAATKSFGMGIDKPDIRYVIHIIPPISLGAYYQEAGRAGRDEKHSHNIMLFVAPSIVCSEELFRGTLKLPICFKLKSLEKGGVYYQGCPYRSDYNDVCDVYHMFQFILDKDVVNVAQETCINGNEQIELIQYKKAWIDKETKELNHFYSVHFINKVNMAEIVVPFADNNSKILQSNLVLFRSIGLISKYTIDYSAKSCRFTKPVFNAGNKKHVFDKTDI